LLGYQRFLDAHQDGFCFRSRKTNVPDLQLAAFDVRHYFGVLASVNRDVDLDHESRSLQRSSS
jgi:hypothetical protein